MFRSSRNYIARHIADLIDDILVGDFGYILDGDDLYADVDYFRKHPHRAPELSWTPSAGRGFGLQRAVIVGPKERRPGTAAARAAACARPGHAPLLRPATVAGRTRAAHR